MNRKILFRGKRVDNDEWVYGYLAEAVNCMTDKKATFIIERDATYFGYTCAVEVQPETVGQFIGLTDKNGNKIFEGDIIKFSHPAFDKSRIGVISYEMNETGFVLRHKRDYNWIAYANKFYEIIGNIHDNKENKE